MGRVDGGETGNIRRHSLAGDGGPAVQPAFGVGDDVHPFTACLRQDLPDAPGGIGCPHRPDVQQQEEDGTDGLLLAVVEHGAVALECPGDAAPVVDIAKIPEEHPVDQKDGVFRPADLALRPGGIQLPLLRLELHLVGGDADDLSQVPDVEEGDPSAESRQHPVLQPQLNRGEVHPDHAVPEEDESGNHQKDDSHQPNQNDKAVSRCCGSVLSDLCITIHQSADGQHCIDGGHRTEYPQQLTSGGQLPDAPGGIGCPHRPDVQQQEEDGTEQPQQPEPARSPIIQVRKSKSSTSIQVRPAATETRTKTPLLAHCLTGTPRSPWAP